MKIYCVLYDDLEYGVLIEAYSNSEAAEKDLKVRKAWYLQYLMDKQQEGKMTGFMTERTIINAISMSSGGPHLMEWPSMDNLQKFGFSYYVEEREVKDKYMEES